MLPPVLRGSLHPEPGMYVILPGDSSCVTLRGDAEKAAAGSGESSSSAVVLIHGLDDSGEVWRELAPALHQAGRCVLFYEYPNDQGIALSADALAAGLREARGRGVERVDLVCHSMGGLVARDVLTRAAYYAGTGDGHEGLPDIGRVILIATPNAGAPIAYVRAPNDLIERTIAWRHAEAPVSQIFDLSSDGDGQAGLDLRPGSAFLTDLNGREPPTGVVLTVIVAQALGQTPADEAGQPVGAGTSTQASAPTSGADRPRGVGRRVRAWWSRIVQQVIRALGDGAVPTDSAALASADETLHVRCSHVGLLNEDPVGGWILETAGQSPERAPAVALVLERVSSDSGAP